MYADWENEFYEPNCSGHEQVQKWLEEIEDLIGHPVTEEEALEPENQTFLKKHGLLRPNE